MRLHRQPIPWRRAPRWGSTHPFPRTSRGRRLPPRIPGNAGTTGVQVFQSQSFSPASRHGQLNHVSRRPGCGSMLTGRQSQAMPACSSRRRIRSHTSRAEPELHVPNHSRLPLSTWHVLRPAPQYANTFPENPGRDPVFHADAICGVDRSSQWQRSEKQPHHHYHEAKHVPTPPQARQSPNPSAGSQSNQQPDSGFSRHRTVCWAKSTASPTLNISSKHYALTG